MIAIDTSALVNFYNNKSKHPKIDQAFSDGLSVLPCVVVSEFLSTPNLPKPIIKNVTSMPRLDPNEGDFWLRLAKSRRSAIQKNIKARIADCIIAQLCADYSVPLITQDSDFKKLARFFKISLL